MLMFKDYPDILTVKQVCEMLNIGRNNAYELVRCGEIKSVTIGRQIRIPKDNVIRFIEKDKDD